MTWYDAVWYLGVHKACGWCIQCVKHLPHQLPAHRPSAIHALHQVYRYRYIYYRYIIYHINKIYLHLGLHELWLRALHCQPGSGLGLSLGPPVGYTWYVVLNKNNNNNISYGAARCGVPVGGPYGLHERLHVAQELLIRHVLMHDIVMIIVIIT